MSGLDPRPEMAGALRLNPFEPLARTAAVRLRTDDPARWRRVALSSSLPGLSLPRPAPASGP